MTDIQKQLFSMQDEGYRDFQARHKLLPTVDPGTIIGVRTPQLRSYAKALAKTPEAADFIKELPHCYFEENNIHGFIIETIRDFDTALEETKKFLPYVDNWATCDQFTPKAFAKNKDKLLSEIKIWLKSGHTYTVRYALGLLMSLYLDDDFRPEHMEMAAEVKSEEYYVNMMQAWYFATALAKQYDCAIGYIIENRLSPWVHNKAIQKSIESRRISDETKELLRKLKI